MEEIADFDLKPRFLCWVSNLASLEEGVGEEYWNKYYVWLFLRDPWQSESLPLTRDPLPGVWASTCSESWFGVQKPGTNMWTSQTDQLLSWSLNEIDEDGSRWRWANMVSIAPKTGNRSSYPRKIAPRVRIPSAAEDESLSSCSRNSNLDESQCQWVSESLCQGSLNSYYKLREARDSLCWVKSLLWSKSFSPHACI